MKTKITLFLAFVTGICFGQSNQFIYEYQFKSDSLNRAEISTENMVLQTSPKGSRFYSQVKQVYDSTLTASFKNAKGMQNAHFDFTHLKQAKVNTEVLKTYPDLKRVLKTRISSTPLVLSHEAKPVWKISNEKSNVLGYDVQKATTEMYGRNWVAWFAPEIPVQDGPHELCGLPGLILKAEDTKGHHVFTLVATKKTEVSTDELTLKKAREIEVNEEKFRKLWSEYKKDPVKDMRQSSGSGTVTMVASVTFDGKTYSQDEMMKEAERERKEGLKKNNNFLELSLYQ